MLKDARLAQLSARYNVARFVSFSPSAEPEIRHLVLGDVEGVEDITSALGALLQLVKTVNVRTFRDDQSKSTPFVYGVDSPEKAELIVRDFASQGLYTIVNETIDINDGGVSGVTLGGVTEFAPGATPRVVEDPNGDVARLPTQMAREMLRTVYGFDPHLRADAGQRLEFSIHPLRVGSRKSHSLVWEVGEVPERALHVHVNWPNAFSRFMGDKAYGLLLAHLSGLPVPQSTVVGRNLAPFTFGRPTGTYETWTRTSPATATPGRFTTVKGWVDPVSLLQREDPSGLVASVIAQEGVDAHYSGGAISTLDGHLVEGVVGRGDEFMLGQTPESLPEPVLARVRDLLLRAEKSFGSAQLEWVDDGQETWIVQLHARPPIEAGRAGTLNPGTPQVWIPFDPDQGVEALRDLAREAAEHDRGIELTRPVGVTSHFGDILRAAGVPARLLM